MKRKAPLPKEERGKKKSTERRELKSAPRKKVAAKKEVARAFDRYKKKAKKSSVIMHYVGIVFEDLKAAVAFFIELGLELEFETQVEGDWVDGVIGLKGARVDMAMMRTPDDHNRLELMQFWSPAAVNAGQK